MTATSHTHIQAWNSKFGRALRGSEKRYVAESFDGETIEFLATDEAHAHEVLRRTAPDFFIRGQYSIRRIDRCNGQ